MPSGPIPSPLLVLKEHFIRTCHGENSHGVALLGIHDGEVLSI